MLVAAGMNAQQLEDKLEGDVTAASKALLADKDPANREELRMMWKQAEERLDSFRRQQVAGGADPKQGCKVGPAWRAAAGGAPGGRLCPGPCNQGGAGPQAWVCR